MPYISQEERESLNPSIDAIAEMLSVLPEEEQAGPLNYVISSLCWQLFDRGRHNYNSLNTLVGAMESAKAEFQRRVVAPYEDEKIKANGDVFR